MLTNAQLAELLAQAAEDHDGHRQRALRRAARAAHYWPEEAGDLVKEGRSLGELEKVGPWLSVTIRKWFEDPPEIPEPPPLRSGFLTFAKARSVVVEHPEWEKGLRGDLQMHSDHSDGRTSIAEMAGAAAGYGYDYIAITDHSKGLKIAGGMSEEELAEEIHEIDDVNRELAGQGTDFRVLRSLEMNINPQGEGDMEPKSLDGLDLVLGSFHSSLQTKDDQTDRYVAALRNPLFKVMGHPRCRMFNRRAGLNADWGRVFEAAVENDKAMEINSHPNRQDLNVELLKHANEVGVRFSIGTDAHSPAELQYIGIGLAAAILADIPRERIINFMSADDLVAWARGS